MKLKGDYEEKEAYFLAMIAFIYCGELGTSCKTRAFEAFRVAIETYLTHVTPSTSIVSKALALSGS